ncbi:MAG TPA: iron-containing alcohol dehydrogenase, partial [Chryseosolibacter sp.]|nr:iron-containing alcohol dehydrogenase [Chryseosolibacter sp.]
NDGVKNYLEGVGTKTHPGTKIPFIAVPTTSGTGSEATKNAVISEVGENGYKKSLRHNNFIPDTALLDPELAVSCPPSQTAASGMDAFTQLLESFVSTNANPLTDALAVKGLELCAGNLLTCYRNGDDIEARAAMALASYISGLTLANAGLGLVHGFASSIGGYHKIPHGVICSRMMSACNDVTIRELKRADNSFVLKKFATIGRMFGKNSGKNTLYYVDHLLAIINEFTHEMQIPKLSDYGVSSVNYVKIVAATDNKFNPVKLSKEQLAEVLELSI